MRAWKTSCAATPLRLRPGTNVPACSFTTIFAAPSWSVGGMPVMQEKIRQGGAYHTALRSSRCSRHDATILHLDWGLQPALDVEQHPRTVRVFVDRLEKKLPVDAVEIAFEVDIEHPVVPPAALT